MLLSLKVHVIIMIQFIFQASYPEVKSKEKRFLNSGGKKIHRTALESIYRQCRADDDETQFIVRKKYSCSL